MIDDKNIARLEDYLDNKLPESEKIILKKELENNAELKELLEFLKITREGIKLSGINQQVRSAHQYYHKNKPSKVVKINSSVWWLSIAASISLILIVGNIWIQKAPSQIIEDNYMAYVVPTMRSSDDGSNTIETDFKNNEWSKVISSVSTTSEDQSKLFLAGMASYHLDNYSEGAKYFEYVLKINDQKSENLYRDEAEFYLSLTLLKLERYDEAYLLAKRIKLDENHIYHTNFTNSDLLKIKVITWLNN